MANSRSTRLIKIVEEADASARKHHILAVMMLRRGNEDDVDGHGPSGSSENRAGGNASKKGPSDEGTYHSIPINPTAINTKEMTEPAPAKTWSRPLQQPNRAARKLPTTI